LKKIVVLFSLMLFFSCTQMKFAKDKFTLYVHMSSEPGSLNPIVSNEGATSTINKYIYETLLDRDYDTLKLKPQLAKSWKISKDKLHFIFYLKRGVLWSDGKEFTADDVVYSYNIMKSPKTASASQKVYYLDVKSVKKLGKYVVEFTYAKPYFIALENCGGLSIVPKHIFDNGTDFNTHKNNRFPIGTGPFKFQKWDTGKKIVLVQNKLYRNKLPEIKRIIYKFVPESNVALQMLKKGNLDVMGIRSIQWVRQTNSKKFLNHFYKFKYYLPYYSYIGWNARRKYFKDRRVRIALTHLINRKAILNKLLFGLGKIVTGNFYINSINYNKKIKPYEFNPQKGIELLKEAGWKDSDNDGILDRNGVKFSFVFTIPSGRAFAERLATILKEDFSKVGIQMDINKYEWAVFVQKIKKHDFDAVTLAWGLGYSADPYQLWHSSQIDKGDNFCGFSNSEADTIIVRARKKFDDEKRAVMYRRFHEIIHYEEPYTFLYCTPALVLVSKRFMGVKVHNRGLNYLEWKIRR